MKHRGLFLLAALTATLGAPALAQNAPSTSTIKKSQVPDFSGPWRHQSLPGPEPLAKGPTSLKNLSRRNGASDYGQLVGDYLNPILKPEASAIVKRNGEIAKSGVAVGNPSSQCSPEPVPFIFKSFAMQMLQEKDKITIQYDTDHQHR